MSLSRSELAVVIWGLLVVFGASGQRLVRSVQGTVRDTHGELLKGAVVQLEDPHTLQIRSYITEGDGEYEFQELSTTVDYRLTPQYKGQRGDSHVLSRFDTGKVATVNLTVDTGKKQ